MKISIPSLSFFHSIVSPVVVALVALSANSSADAQSNSNPLRPKTSICSTRSLAALDRQVTAFGVACQRNQARLTRLQQRKAALDARDQAALTALESLYGVQITLCADSFLSPTNGVYPTAACAVIDEPSLLRAYNLVQRRVQANLNKQARDAQYNADLLTIGNVCVKASSLQASTAWTKQECSTLQAG